MSLGVSVRLSLTDRVERERLPLTPGRSCAWEWVSVGLATAHRIPVPVTVTVAVTVAVTGRHGTGRG